MAPGASIVYIGGADCFQGLPDAFYAAINNQVADILTNSYDVEGERIGVLNRAFGGFYQLRLRAKQLKAWSRTTYYFLKWALLGGLFYLVFVQ
jgi:hypothetical protein